MGNDKVEANQTHKNTPAFYMGWHKDKNILQKSSSGGIFTAVAMYVLKNNGIVVGAFLEKKSRLIKHIIIDNEAELEKLRLSKYYQSDTADVYNQVQEYLNEGQLVLFTGTACQIAALYNVVGYHENLITVDVLCHGATSKMVVDSYLSSQEKSFKKKISAFYFRVKEKKVGWQSGGGTRMKLEFSDGTSYVADKFTDTFFIGFNENIILRDSCYSCPYSGSNRVADITIGDFWGVTSKRATEEQMKNGISLILVNTDKGHRIMQEIADDVIISPIDPEEAIPHNKALEKPNERSTKRTEFFDRLKSGEDYNGIIKGYYRKRFFNAKIKRTLIKILGEDKFERLHSCLKSN